jgi:hypothetical protein
MTGTRPAKMDQNLSNDVQDKTADISGSGPKADVRICGTIERN